MSDPRPATLSASDVLKVSRLACLDLTPAQVEAYRGTLSAVLGYVERLRELNLDGVEPMTHPLDAVNRLAPDEPGETLPTGALMTMAPDADEPFLKVPKVLGEGSGA